MNVNQTDEERQEIYKIVLVGDSGVGKTCLLNQYVKKLFPKNVVPTIGVEFATKVVTLKNGEKIKAQIWDTAGQERYRSIANAHYRNAKGALLVYDITKEKTFDNVSRWIEDLRNASEPDLVIKLVGNKIDLCENDSSKRKVTVEEGRTLAADNSLSFSETSASDNIKVIPVFEDLLNEINMRHKNENKTNVKNNNELKLSNGTKPKETKCGGC